MEVDLAVLGCFVLFMRVDEVRERLNSWRVVSAVNEDRAVGEFALETDFLILVVENESVSLFTQGNVQVLRFLFWVKPAENHVAAGNFGALGEVLN